MQSPQGKLLIVSGPSGSGKSSLCAALLERTPNLHLSISCTTRPPRPGEQDGREYRFLSKQQFIAQRDAGAFLEWAQVHGNFYGTRESDVRALLERGEDVLLEIDWQGAAQVAAKIPEAVRIFILPPSIEVLRQRLIDRAQDNLQVVNARVAAAEAEMAHADEAHLRIVNDCFEDALAQMQAFWQQNRA